MRIGGFVIDILRIYIYVGMMHGDWGIRCMYGLRTGLDELQTCLWSGGIVLLDDRV